MPAPKRIQNSGVKTGNPSVSFSLPKPLAAGNLLYIMAVGGTSYYWNATVTGAGNTCTQLNPVGSSRGAHWICRVQTGGAQTIQVAIGIGAYISVVAIELSGVDNANPVAVHVLTENTPGNDTPATPPILSNNVGELLIAWTGQKVNSNVRYAMGSGWTIDPLDAPVGVGADFATETILNIIPGTRYTPNFKQNASTSWVCGVAMFTPATFDTSTSTAITNVANVKEDFGAVGNTRVFAGASITVNTPTLTFPAGFLSASDEGKRVDVVGAGPGGSVMTAMVITVVGNTATLSANASTDLTAPLSTLVSVGTDDTTAIRTAILALPQILPKQSGIANELIANGGICYFPPGNYKVYSIPALGEVTLQGNGNGSVLTAAPVNPDGAAVEVVSLFYPYPSVQDIRIRSLTVDAHQGYGVWAFNPSQKPPTVTLSAGSVPAGTYTFQYVYNLARPAAPSVSTLPNGGLLASTTYYAVVTYVNTFGETIASASGSATTSATNKTIRVSAPTPAGNATGWRCYIGTTSTTLYLQSGPNALPFGAPFDLATPPSVITPNPPLLNTTGYDGGLNDPATRQRSGGLGSEATSVTIETGTTQKITVEVPTPPPDYTGADIYLVGGIKDGFGNNLPGIVDYANAGNSYRVEFNAAFAPPVTEKAGYPSQLGFPGCEITDCILSAAKTAVYFRAPCVYSQWASITRNLFRDLGAGAITIDGNINVIQNNDLKGSVRGATNGGFTAPSFGFIEVRGSQPLIQDNIADLVYSVAASPYYVGPTQHRASNHGGGADTANVRFYSNWCEPGPNMTLPVKDSIYKLAFQFEGVQGLDCDKLQVAKLVDVANFNACRDVRIRRLDIGADDTETTLRDYLRIDPNDLTTYIRINRVHCGYDAGNLEDPRIFVDGYYSASGGSHAAFVPGVSAPLTGNLIANGDFENDTLGWTLVPPPDPAFNESMTVEDVPQPPNGDALGKRLKIVLRKPGVTHVLYAPKVNIPGAINTPPTPDTGMNNAPGWLRYGFFTDPTNPPISSSNFFSLYVPKGTNPGAYTVPTRSGGGTVLVPIEGLNNGSVMVDYNNSNRIRWYMKGEGTWCLDNVQVTLGQRPNNVANGSASWRWFQSDGTKRPPVMTTGTAPPSAGTWPQGSIVWNTNPSLQGTGTQTVPIGWVRLASSWADMHTLSATPQNLSATGVPQFNGMLLTGALTATTGTFSSTLSTSGFLNGAASILTTGSTLARALEINHTWNNGATTYKGIQLNATNTASASASRLIDLQVGGLSKFDVDATGLATAVFGTALLRGDNNAGSGGAVQITFGWSGTTYPSYRHYIRTRHNGGSTDNNAIDFFTSDGTSAGGLGTAILGLSINGGEVGVGELAPGAKLDVKGNADSIQLRVRGHSTQNASLQEWQDSAGTVQSKITAKGAWSPPVMDDASSSPNTIYYSTTTSKLVYRPSTGSPIPLY